MARVFGPDNATLTVRTKRTGAASKAGHDLLIDVWGYNGDIFTRTVDVHIASLRQKLETDPKRPVFIQTVQRVGYKFTGE